MLDEPMAGVNPALTQSLLGHILDLKTTGMTVLFVEHDMHMVRTIADWVIVMAEGKIVAEGYPRRRHGRPGRHRRLPRRPPRHRPRQPHRAARGREGRWTRLWSRTIEEELDAEAAGIEEGPTHEHRDRADGHAAHGERASIVLARDGPRRGLRAGRQHPERLQRLRRQGASSSASSARTAPASRRC